MNPSFAFQAAVARVVSSQKGAGRGVSDVFISYARSTEAQAIRITEALRALGYVVWRDDQLPAHRAYGDVIEERLKAAMAVVVIWSAEAAKSQWVYSEANRAREGGKLVQLSIESARLPKASCLSDGNRPRKDRLVSKAGPPRPPGSGPTK